MRRAILVLLSAVISGTAVSAQQMQRSILGAEATVTRYEYISDSLYVDIELDLANFDLRSSESVVFAPGVFSHDKELSLPTIVVRGRSGVKSYNRSQTLKNVGAIAEYDLLYRTPNQFVDYYGRGLKSVESSGGIVFYSYVLAYETWMADSHIFIDCSSYSCCNATENGVLMPQNNQLYIDIPVVERIECTPKLSLIKPERVAVKRRDIEYRSSLTFKSGSSTIDPSLEGNRRELKSIGDMMQSVLSDSDYTITAVNITGYASPEGSLKSNQVLSEKRAKSVEATLIREVKSVPAKLYHIRFGGENWEALATLVEESSMEHKQKILDIIKHVPVDQGREKQLMDLAGGVPYRYMLKNLFPLVRVVVVEIEYNVDAYDLSRISELIDVKPENLSMEEFYRLSESYAMDSPEFSNIFRRAAKVYPNDEIAACNALVADLAAADLESASRFVARLDESSKSAEVVNALGAYYMMVEEYDMAKTLLRRSEALGSSDATENLDLLERIIKNSRELQESRKLRAKVYGSYAVVD